MLERCLEIYGRCVLAIHADPLACQLYLAKFSDTLLCSLSLQADRMLLLLVTLDRLGCPWEEL